jgi:uncharacterized membrane protein
MESAFLIAVVIAVVYFLWRLSSRMQQLHHRFDSLDQELREIRQSLSSLKPAAKPGPEEKPFPAEVKSLVPPRPVLVPEEVLSSMSKAASMPPETVAATPGEAVFSQPTNPAAREADVVPALAPPAPQPGLVARFLKNNPDLEKFIGENLINKIGIAILVLGIGYFVKFAIDQDWINEIGRVFIGLLAGGGLIGLAHRMRHTLPAFSSVLVGGGLAVLYFTVAIAFHEYRLFPQAAAFIIMVVITGFSILLSVSYNRMELAVLSLLGGFATPFMVSTGAGNYQVLFTYILILNAGMLVLAYLKGWKILNWIAYFFTVVLYGGWLSTRVFGVVNAPLVGALVFGTLFYLIFFGMNIINNLKEKIRFAAADITILLSNTFLYYAAGMLVLADIRQGLYQGLFTVVLAIFNFVFAYLLFRSQRADRNLIYLLLGLVITFISLAIPVQLEGNYITMFWALEAVLLLWLYWKSDLKLIFLSSIIMSGLMVISLVMDWNNLYLSYAGKTPLPVLINKAFITSCISLAALALITRLLRRLSAPVAFRYLRVDVGRYRHLAGGMLGVLLYLALVLELHYQLNRYVSFSLNRTILIGAYNLAFLVGLLLFARLKNQPRLTWGITCLGLPGVLAYVVLFSPSVLRLLKVHYLEGEPSFIGFWFHYLSLLLVILLLTFLYRNISRLTFLRPAAARMLVWALGAAVVYIASSELLFHVIYFNFPLPAPVSGQDYSGQAAGHLAALTRQTNKVGFPILWGLCAFVLMFAGLRQKNKNLRIMALSLFTLTLLKLFIYDIRGISEGGKIAAFIFLGVLLLVISFMYQNLKRLILTDEAAPKADQ